MCLQHGRQLIPPQLPACFCSLMATWHHNHPAPAHASLCPPQVSRLNRCCCLQTRQKAVQVLYAEVQSRSMQPSTTSPPQPAVKAGSASQTDAKPACCRSSTNGTSCVSATPSSDAGLVHATASIPSTDAAVTVDAAAAGSSAVHSRQHASSQQSPSSSLRNSHKPSNHHSNVDAELQRSTSSHDSQPTSVATDSAQQPGSSPDEASIEPVSQTTATEPPMSSESAIQCQSTAPHPDAAASPSPSPAPSPESYLEAGGAAERCSGASCADPEGSVGQIAGYTWRLPPGLQQGDCTMLWIGSEGAAALTHLQLTFSK